MSLRLVDLTDDVIGLILQYVEDPYEIRSLSTICKRFYVVIKKSSQLELLRKQHHLIENYLSFLNESDRKSLFKKEHYLIKKWEDSMDDLRSIGAGRQIQPKKVKIIKNLLYQGVPHLLRHKIWTILANPTRKFIFNREEFDVSPLFFVYLKSDVNHRKLIQLMEQIIDEVLIKTWQDFRVPIILNIHNNVNLLLCRKFTFNQQNNFYVVK